MLVKTADKAQIRALSPLLAQYPVDWIEHKWPTHNGSLEEIIRLNPDLVITGEYNAIQLRSRLASLGFRVEILPLPTSVSGLNRYQSRFMQLVGNNADTPRQPEYQTTSKPPRVLLLGANGVGTGQKTLENEILQYSGMTNYLSEEGYISLNIEQLINDPPDLMLWSAPDAAALANQFAEHAALKKAIPQQQWLSTDYWYWQCPGPWTWELIQRLRQWQKQ